MNIIGYIKKYGNLSFSSMPFNEIDSLILCQLSYLNFDPYCPAYKDFKKHPIRLKNIKIKNKKAFYSLTVTPAPMKTLMNELVKTRRFGNVKVGYVHNVFDEEKICQFYALTFFLSDGSMYIAYRGTDTTLLGWKEDFLFTYVDEVSSQKLANEYAHTMLEAFPNNVYFGGHSKGGNLAMYSAFKMGRENENRLIKVYSFDGPGFRTGKKTFESFDRTCPKIEKYITQNDIVGMIYIIMENTKIVNSTGLLIGGHDPFYWQILNDRPEFKYCTDRKRGSKVMQQALTNWLTSLTLEDKKLLVDGIFQLFRASKTVFDLRVLAIRDIVFNKKAMEKYTKVEQIKLRMYLENFIHYYFDAFFNFKEDKKKIENKEK